ncbi:hypothetical protein [Mycobacterium neglectum]|uniref:hypothetical protein n=1 Tax=Mycobacterium neglectum TaxID=242737 RepID=UPI001FE894AC|nr:hypothetical protein [Mycobacterium neglectum]
MTSFSHTRVLASLLCGRKVAGDTPCLADRLASDEALNEAELEPLCLPNLESSRGDFVDWSAQEVFASEGDCENLKYSLHAARDP